MLYQAAEARSLARPVGQVFSTILYNYYSIDTAYCTVQDTELIAVGTEVRAYCTV